MCSETPDPAAILDEFQTVAKQLEAVLKDIEWRKPDVEAEEAKLRDLIERAKTDPMVDAASQAIVVRVLRGVLNDKIAEVDRLEKRMLDLKGQLEALEAGASKPEEGEKPGEALR